MRKEGLIKGGILAAATAAMFALALGAAASPVQIGFNGAGGTGHVSLVVGPDTLPSATLVDPAGALLITSASGTFSDTNLGLSNVSITGVMKRNFATPADVADGKWQPGYVPFPASFSTFVVTNSTPPGAVVTYDNLFYPGGSPSTCWDYPFFGGFLDDYGVMLTLHNGGFVDLWSDGVTPGGLTYGFAAITSDGRIDYQFSGVRAAVPEPDFLWLFGAAMLGLFTWRRIAEKKA